MRSQAVLRGQIWRADIGPDERKRVLVVSNNSRNAALPTVLTVRLTTARKPALPTIVEFGPGEAGESKSSVLTDDILLINKERLDAVVGALTPSQMRRVDKALCAALAISV